MAVYVSAFEMSILRVLGRKGRVPSLTDLCDELGEMDRVKVERSLRRVQAIAQGVLACGPMEPLDRGSNCN